MLPEQVDIAIVGSGVSGGSVALAASRNGVSVAIFEEHAEVGEPSHCSGHVGIAAFKRFAPNFPNRIIENEIKGAKLYAPNGESLTLFRQNPVTWVLNRAAFDRHLAFTAERSGAWVYLNSRVEAFKRTDDGCFQIKVKGAQDGFVKAKVLIDAAGCGGSISKYAKLPQPNPRMIVNSAQFNVENLTDVNSELVEVYFGQSYAPGFFGWIIPRRDGSAKVGIAAAHRANVRQCFERFVKRHPIASKKLARGKVLSQVTYHPIPVGGALSRTYADSVLAVGDAASQVKPTTGGGIVFGLACGQIAGETALEAVQAGDSSSSRLRLYEEKWRQLIGFDLNAMSWLRKMLYRIPDRYLNRIFTVSRGLRTDEILNRTADIDFQGRTIFSLARDPRLFVTLLSASLLSAPSLLTTEAVSTIRKSHQLESTED
jgi:digeranylgeranylglycerophospholipid reductase